jgi:hypothetical protein
VKNYLLTLLILLFLVLAQKANSQTSCSEMIRYVESESYGSIYYSSGSDAIAHVTFYDLLDKINNTNYYAVVRFKSSQKDYIYQVSSDTRRNYIQHYSNSAGEAFWKYIEPHNSNLNCKTN